MKLYCARKQQVVFNLKLKAVGRGEGGRRSRKSETPKAEIRKGDGGGGGQ